MQRRIGSVMILLSIGLFVLGGLGGNLGAAQSQAVLQVSPSSLSFAGQAGGPQPDPQFLSISNAGGGLLEWQASTDVNWITLGAAAGKLSGGRTIKLLVLANTEGLAAGTHQGTITIEDPNAQGSPAIIPITLSLEPPIKRGRLLYQDDFSKPSSGWFSGENSEFTWAYEDGEYSGEEKRGGFFTWECAPADQSFSDFIIEVDVKQISPYKDNTHGLFFRLTEDEQARLTHYEFAITGNGEYQFTKRVQSKFETVVRQTSSPQIHRGQSTNHLSIVAKGNRFDLYVNGVYLTTIIDRSITAAGQVCLFVSSNSDPSAHIHFDNVKVYSIDQ